MTLLLRESDVAALLAMPAALAAVEDAFRHMAAADAFIHPRRRAPLPDKVFLHHMAAADTVTGYAGLKVYTSAHGKLRFLVLLYSVKSGELLALIEADLLGQIRTGAASGVATKFLARPDTRSIGILGSGLQARTQLEAVCAVRNIDRITCYSRKPERRTAFAAEMSAALGIPVEPAPSAEAAVRGRDVVIVVTTASAPVLLGDWLSPGMHINAVGANMPQKRELDEAAVRRADLIVADSIEQSLIESGDLLQVFGHDLSAWAPVKELAHIISGEIPGRTRPEEITLFKSNGIALEDIAVAGPIYEAAVNRRIGVRIPLWENWS